MPQVRYAPGAIRDLQRLRELLCPKNPVAAKRAGETQEGRADSRPSTTNRLVEDMPDQHREWLVDFGDSGYVVPYRIGGNAITITGCAPPERSRVFLARLRLRPTRREFFV